MQFDDGLENDNNKFSLEDDDSSAISWQDLLGDDDSSKNKKEVTDDVKLDAPSFDILEVQDEIVKNEEQLPSKDDIADKASSFDLTDNKEQNLNNEVSNDNFSYSEAENSLLNENNDDSIKLNDEDVSNVLDEELLNLLNEEDDKPTNNANETEIVETPDSELSLNTVNADVDSDIFSEDDIQNINAESGNYQDDVVPLENNDRKSKSVVLILLVLLVLIAGGAYLIYNFMSSSVETNVDVENTPVENNIQTSDKIDDAAITRKKAKEIEEKAKEEELNEDDEAQENKKIIVQVPVDGRRNPFVPSPNFNDVGLASVGLDFSSIPDINEDDPAAIEARKLFEISVSGIMYDAKKPSAILKFDGKDYFVQVGDRIDTYTVHYIAKDYVAIRNSANVYKAYVGEKFALENAEIPPSKQMKTKNGQRQYISSEDVSINVKQ